MDERVQADMTYYILIFCWWMTGEIETIAYFAEKEHCFIAQEVYSKGVKPLGEMTVMCVLGEMK